MGDGRLCNSPALALISSPRLTAESQQVGGDDERAAAQPSLRVSLLSRARRSRLQLLSRDGRVPGPVVVVPTAVSAGTGAAETGPKEGPRREMRGPEISSFCVVKGSSGYLGWRWAGRRATVLFSGRSGDQRSRPVPIPRAWRASLAVSGAAGGACGCVDSLKGHDETPVQPQSDCSGRGGVISLQGENTRAEVLLPRVTAERPAEAARFSSVGLRSVCFLDF
jgi:hypothetical protein